MNRNCLELFQKTGQENYKEVDFLLDISKRKILMVIAIQQ